MEETRESVDLRLTQCLFCEYIKGRIIMKEFTGKQKLSFLFIAIGAALTVAAFIAGISDNLPGILLLYTGITAVVVGFVHPWRSVKKFLILLGTSFAGFFVFVVLHNGMYAFGIKAAGIALLSRIFGIFGGIFFLIAVLLCPVGILVGSIGSIITFILSRKRKLPDEETPAAG